MRRRDFFRGAASAAAAVVASPVLLSGGMEAFLIGKYGAPNPLDWVVHDSIIVPYNEGLKMQLAVMAEMYGRPEF